MTTSGHLTDTAAPPAEPDGITFSELVRRPATAVWLVLMAATIVSWWLGEGHGAAETATVIVLAVAFFKVLLVGYYFMELRTAAVPLRVVFTAWAVVVPIVLVVMYLATD